MTRLRKMMLDARESVLPHIFAQILGEQEGGRCIDRMGRQVPN
jgi:hypothetical protein